MSAFTGTTRLLRLAMRRDRVTLPLVMMLAIGMVGGTAPALVSTYGSSEDTFNYISSAVPSVVGRLFQGAVQGPTIGSVLIAEVMLFGMIIIAIMSIFIVSRHTRHNEETGAGELIGSGIIGRSAPLTAALLLAIFANFATGLVIFGVLASIPEFDNTSSSYLAMALSSFGIVMASVSAVTAQLSDYRRGSNLMAMSVLGAFFVIRALGDALGNIGADGLSVTTSPITWLSPMGWGYQVLPFADNRIFPIVMSLVLAIALSGFAYFLMSKRDIGSSIFNSKPGPARAKASLLSAGGLAHRLQKGNLIAWTIGYATAGILIAVVANDFRSTFEDSELFSDFVSAAGGSNFLESIIAAMFPLLAALLSGYVISAVTKLHDEESSGRIEYLLSTSLGKVRWLFSHVGYALLGILLTLGVMGAAGGIGYSIVAESTNELSGVDVMLASLVNIPAMALFLAIIVLVYASAGRFVKSFAWAFYAYCALIGSIGGIFAWPAWTSSISPFYHTPVYPGSAFDWLPIFIMGGLTVLVLMSSAKLFSARDLSLK